MDRGDGAKSGAFGLKAMSGSIGELRSRAEGALRRQGTCEPEGSAAADYETRRLIHELRVHKIELEAQNDELRQAQLDLEAARSRYLDLFNLAPVGYLTLTENGLIQEANIAAANVLGVEKSRLPGTPLSQFIAPDRRDAYYAHRHRVFNGSGRDVCEIALRRKDGSQRCAELESIFAPDAQSGDGRWWMVLTDITERNRVDVQLRKLSTAVEHSPAMVLIANPDGEIEYVNSKFLAVTGYTTEEIVGKTPSLLASEGVA